MKYRIIGLCTTVCMLVAVVSASFAMPEDNGERYIEHTMEAEKPLCASHEAEVLCSHLPLVKIDTEGVEIPGLTVWNEELEKHIHTKASDGSTTIAGRIELIDHEEERNHLSDTPTLTSDIRIRMRGNSSRFFDKPNYYLELRNPDGTNNPQELLGMDAHHEWALHGPFLDKTLIRNYLCYNLAGEMMDYSPNVRFFELVLNGEYRGLYLLTETVTAGKDGARLELEVDKKDNTFSGYVLKHDRGSDTPQKNIEPFSMYAKRTSRQINIEYPGTDNLTPELAEAIRQDFSDFEKAIYSFDFDHEKYGYKATTDVDSFVDYFIINEVMVNRDAGIFSTYIYKGTDQKYRMCVWDFNNALENYEETYNHYEGFAMQGNLWFDRLVQDKDFTERVIERYFELRETVLSDEYLEKFIDETVDYLGDAVDRNYQVWGYSFEPEYDRLTPEWRNPRSYEESVDSMKTYLKKRLAWMDENIDVLRQYSAPSKTRESHEVVE